MSRVPERMFCQVNALLPGMAMSCRVILDTRQRGWVVLRHACDTGN